MSVDGGQLAGGHPATRKADDAELPAEPLPTVPGGAGTNLEQRLRWGVCQRGGTV